MAVNIMGEKVVLRAVEEQDNEMLKELMNAPYISNMIGGWSFPVSSYAQMEWYKGQLSNEKCVRYVVETITDQQAIGMVSLAEIDFKNGTAYVHIKLTQCSQGKGYGYDALHALCDYAFSELRLEAIYSEIIEDNIPSQNLFHKLGFVKDGMLRSRLFKRGKRLGLMVFSLLNGDLK